MKCCIVKDLLPGYIDGLTSEETNAEVETHLQGCDACRTAYEQMSSELQKELLPEKKDIDFLRKLKSSIRQQYVLGAYLVCAILFGMFSFLHAYALPVPYDPERMTVETILTAGEGTGGSKEQLRLILQESVQSDGMESVGRTIWRDGEAVRVIYYCYTRSLWGSLFPKNASFVDYSVSEGAVFESSFFRDPKERYKPQKREVYYLPTGNMKQLNWLSDEEFDAQKENAVPLFCGVI